MIGCSTWMRVLTSRKLISPSAPTRNSHVPALTYPASRKIAAAAPSRVRRCSSVRKGAGASSTSFWLRRCREQSRVPSTTTPPAASATTCASTCRGRSRKRSTKHSPRPKAPRASRAAASKASPTSSTSRTTRIPRPPPPWAALMMMGSPCSSAKARAWAASSSGPSVPGASGAPAARAISRARILSPSASMVSGEGPIHRRPAAITARAKPADSARNP
ncbi:Uncharacterised protein [Mycobacteroides abscessus subsp. abscessus]|nr:Uncharacterised protein [Mycobacteroides abscessus subsp. abscessus]